MTEVRSNSTAEFELAAVRLLTDSKSSLAEAARQLHIGENMPRRRRDDYQKRGPPGLATGLPARADRRRGRGRDETGDAARLNALCRALLGSNEFTAVE